VLVATVTIVTAVATASGVAALTDARVCVASVSGDGNEYVAGVSGDECDGDDAGVG